MTSPQLDQRVVHCSESQWKCPQILIGLDLFFEFFVSASPTKSGFSVIQTLVGPIVAGKGFMERVEAVEEQTAMFSALDVDSFWRLESVGIHDSPIEREDSLAVDQLTNSLNRQKDGRYSVSWPYKENLPEVTENFGVALAGLKSIFGNAKHDRTILQQYDSRIVAQTRI